MTGLSRRTILTGFGLAAASPAVAAPPTARNAAVPVAETALPAGTRDMRARIMQAAQGGDIRRLRIPIERNELPPIFARGARGDPIALLKARSADGEGKEMLAILLRALAGPAAALQSGAAPTQYLWPAYAALPYARRSMDARSGSWGLVRVADIGISVMAGEPLIHRVIIGADGTWQLFATG